VKIATSTEQKTFFTIASLFFDFLVSRNDERLWAQAITLIAFKSKKRLNWVMYHSSENSEGKTIRPPEMNREPLAFRELSKHETLDFADQDTSKFGEFPKRPNDNHSLITE
jgi:hypothetical protein